jgi:3-mercaptopyruvate sulfurtransferase SseA
VPVPELQAQPAWIAPAELSARLAETVVVDVGRSRDYRAGHIPGAVWGIRSRLAALGPALAGAREVVVTSPDAVIARLAVPELSGLTAAPVRVLKGGTQAWREAGLPLDADRNDPPDAACVDVWLRPYDRNEGVEQAMRDYLAWETGLPAQLARDGTVRFGVA